MTAGTPARRDPLAWIAILCLLGAVVVPARILTGAVEPGDPRQLHLGAWIWRGAVALLGIFLWCARHAPAGAPRSCAAVRQRGWLLLALLVPALSFRLIALESGLWLDEIAMLIDFVRKPLGEVLRAYPSDNQHPLYTLCAWVSARLLGEEAWTIRLPAVLCGVLSVAAVFALGCRLTSRAEAFLAAALLAVSYHHVWFSQNARGYTALLWFSVLSCHSFLAGMQEGSRRAWLLQGISLALATFTHTTAVLLGISQALVYLWWRCSSREPRRGRARLLAPALGIVLGGLLSLALHALMLPQMLGFYGGEGQGFIEAEWTRPLWMVAETARNLGSNAVLGAAVLVGALLVFLAGFRSYWREQREMAGLFVLPGLLGAVLLIALGRNLWPRFFFFLAGFGALLVVRGVNEVASRLIPQRLRAAPSAARWGFALWGLLVMSLILLLPRTYAIPKQDYAGARRHVESLVRPGEVVMTAGLATFPYQAYYGGGFLAVETVEDVKQVLATAPGAYLIYTLPIFLQSRSPDLWSYLEQHGREVGRFRGSVGNGDVVILRLAP